MTDAIPGATDAELVARVLTADRDAFAQVYDRYGDKLYDFAYSMLRHREDAADTVADSFVLFAERLPQLRDPDRLRPWLYAIVRSECLRRLKARKRVSYGDDEQLIAMADDAKTPEQEAETAALRQLVWDAAAGLADRDRALLDLHLRQGLEGAELAEAMGVNLSNSYVMVNRLKAQVDRSLGALLIARMGRDDCDELDSLLSSWDGTFSVLIRKRVARHVEGCETCGERRKRMVAPWALLAGVPLFTAPAALRDRVLNDTHLVAYGAPGETVATTGGSTGALRTRRGLTAAAAAAVLLLGGGATIWAANDDSGQTPSALIGTPTADASSDPTTTADPTPPTAGPTATAPATPSASASPTDVSTATEGPAPGALAVTTTSVDLGTSTASRTVEVVNVGGEPIAFSVRPQEGWIRASAPSGPVAPGTTALVRVSAARGDLPEGDVLGNLVLDWKGGTATVRVSARREIDPVVGRPTIPGNSSCVTPVAFRVSVKVTDTSGVSQVRIRWTGPSSGSRALTRGANDTWFATVGLSEVGDYRFSATAVDTRGNTATGPATAVTVFPCPG